MMRIANLTAGRHRLPEKMALAITAEKDSGAAYAHEFRWRIQPNGIARPH
jgi:hypothetical protein